MSGIKSQAAEVPGVWVQGERRRCQRQRMRCELRRLRALLVGGPADPASSDGLSAPLLNPLAQEGLIARELFMPPLLLLILLTRFALRQTSQFCCCIIA